MEAWRFTDLSGFDPDAFAVPDGHVGVRPRHAEQAMLDIDAAAVATVGEDGIQIGRAPEGVTFEPLTDDAERLGTLVGADDKFTAHNAALWKHGLLVRVAEGRPAREAALRAHRQHLGRRRRSSGACSSWPRRAAASA